MGDPGEMKSRQEHRCRCNLASHTTIWLLTAGRSSIPVSLTGSWGQTVNTPVTKGTQCMVKTQGSCLLDETKGNTEVGDHSRK